MSQHKSDLPQPCYHITNIIGAHARHFPINWVQDYSCDIIKEFNAIIYINSVLHQSLSFPDLCLFYPYFYFRAFIQLFKVHSFQIILNVENYIIFIIIPTHMIAGKDDKGSYYPSINDMWEMELNNKTTTQGKVIDPIGSQSNWYNKANEYWKNSQASYNGVLGGFENLSSTDISASFKFVFSFYKTHPEHQRNRVIDCGAGIGRIAKQLLCQVYKTVDVIDQCDKYIEKAKDILKGKNIGHFYTKGLQQFDFEQKYDCIWIQWVISHLTDQDAVKFLVKAKAALNQNGFIILKQNHWQKGFSLDKDDYSVTRSKELFAELFKRAGLKVVQQEVQSNWPKQLLQVRMYLLQ